MKDVQNQTDTRGIAIDQVGISDLRYPIQVLDSEGRPFPTVAMISMSVHLPHHFKGTHMSRFLEVLSVHEGEVTMHTLPAILHDLKTNLDAEEAHIEVVFTYFVTKKAPVSGSPAKVGCDCVFLGTSNGSNDHFALRVTVPVTTLCPCSKEISDYGAHNQRATSLWRSSPRRSPKAAGSWSGSRNSSCNLDAAVKFGGPTLLLCGTGMAKKLPTLKNVRVVPVSNPEAKRFSCGLVGLKGDLAARLLHGLHTEPDKVAKLLDPKFDLMAWLEKLTDQQNNCSCSSEVDRITRTPKAVKHLTAK